MEQLMQAGKEVGGYVSMTFPKGTIIANDLNVLVPSEGYTSMAYTENANDTVDTVEENIKTSGHIENKHLWRRFVMAHFLKMMYYDADLGNGSCDVSKTYERNNWNKALKEWYTYSYQFKMMANEIKVIRKLMDSTDKDDMIRCSFFTSAVIIETCERYSKDLKKYLTSLPTHKCNRKPYVRIKGIGNVFCTDLNEYVNQADELIRSIKVEVKNYGYTKRLEGMVRKLPKIVKLPDKTPKCGIWKDTFMKEGAYYTMDNLIKFHGCVFKNETDKEMDMKASLGYIKDNLNKKNGYQYRLMVERLIEDSNLEERFLKKDWCMGSAQDNGWYMTYHK